MKGLRNILLVLGLSITATMALPAAQIQQPRLRTSYTIILKKTHVYPDGRTIDVYTEKRFVAPTGEWFSVKVFADGRLESALASPGTVRICTIQGDRGWTTLGPIRRLFRIRKST